MGRSDTSPDFAELEETVAEGAFGEVGFENMPVGDPLGVHSILA